MKNSMLPSLIAAVSIATFTVACTERAAPPAPQAAVVSAPPPITEAERQTQALIERTKTPLYSMKDGDDYGYEPANSEADKNIGLKTKPLVIFRYLGRKGDTYQVVMINDEFRNVFEVSKPFEFAKIHSFYKDRYQGKEVMRLVDGTLAAAAIRDAMLGHMKQWTRVEKGVATTLWVDADKKRLVVEAAATSGVVQ